MNGKFATVQDVADRYGWSTRTVHGKAAAGLLPVWKPPHSRRLLFDLAALEQFEAGAELELVELRGGGRLVRPVNNRAGDGRAE